VGKALLILQNVSLMARQSAEGQATELEWCKQGNFHVTDGDYLRMVHQKTTYYSFIAPVNIGAMVAGASAQQALALRLFATALGTAFQIQDDILNLAADESHYGKDLECDLWEGKHTLILLHALRSCTESERTQALRALSKPRPQSPSQTGPDLQGLLSALASEPNLTSSTRLLIRSALDALEAREGKSLDDVQFLRSLIERYRSVDYARGRAMQRARRAERGLTRMDTWLSPGVHRDFLHELTRFVVDRDH
ncbi:MAG TPA: polyprenyl synthetase family protein, partial [Polyangiales bacterium]